MFLITMDKWKIDEKITRRRMIQKSEIMIFVII